MALDLNKPAGILVKTTCVDYPGLVAGSFFLKGCNLRCPYCYNISLVSGQADNLSGEFATVQTLFDHLEKRQGLLQGLVISGGEPLLNPYTPLIISKAKELGYKVKLDTNGSLPFELQAFLDNCDLRPDFVAMDIKTSPARYATELCSRTSKFYGNEDYWKKTIAQSAQILSKLPASQREYRTVLVPGLVSKADIKSIAAYLPEDASWRFAQFLNKNCLNPAYNEITPYTDREAEELVNYTKNFIPDSSLR